MDTSLAFMLGLTIVVHTLLILTHTLLALVHVDALLLLLLGFIHINPLAFLGSLRLHLLLLTLFESLFELRRQIGLPF